MKLFHHALIFGHFDTEALGNHGQTAEGPTLPLLRIFVRGEQLTEMTKRPCHLITIALHISIVGYARAQHACNVTPYRWFLCYTYNHAAKLRKIFEIRKKIHNKSHFFHTHTRTKQ